MFDESISIEISGDPKGSSVNCLLFGLLTQCEFPLLVLESRSDRNLPFSVTQHIDLDDGLDGVADSPFEGTNPNGLKSKVRKSLGTSTT